MLLREVTAKKLEENSPDVIAYVLTVWGIKPDDITFPISPSLDGVNSICVSKVVFIATCFECVIIEGCCLVENIMIT